MPANYNWYKLDNAAIIMPSTTQGADTRVFRICCELKEEVDPEILQKALDLTIAEFPHFNVILRKGLFWYYLDEIDAHPLVTEDNKPACAPLYYPGRRNLLYRVNYFGKRINLEMFHVLADGTGGFTFFKKIVMHYLSIAHDLPIPEDAEESSSATEKNGDAFRRFYSKDKNKVQWKTLGDIKAYQIKQVRDDNMQNHLLEGTVSAGKFIELSHVYETTAGILSVAIFIEAVVKSMSVREMHARPVCISVPVNLRQYYPSETTRNFFGVISVHFKATDYDGTLESILPAVKQSFAEQLTEENIRYTMNGYSDLVHNPAIKLVPLFIKDLFIGYFTSRSRRGTTGTMSNLGRIRMPENMEPYIDRFSPFMSSHNVQICVSTFGDKMVFGALSAYVEHRVLINFFRRLEELGMDVELGTNDYDAEPAGQDGVFAGTDPKSTGQGKRDKKAEKAAKKAAKKAKKAERKAAKQAAGKAKK
ncbi:MAG: hypothetical protein K6A92_05315 [Lachnospiraceae bacterium]|nr:hypothetical protein [Lachnospiraceae bacterium]